MTIGEDMLTWTTMAAQPMHIDSALQELLNPGGGRPAGKRSENFTGASELHR